MAGKEIYFNTRTSATRAMSKSDLDKLGDNKKNWRPAAESEIELHEKREAENKKIVENQKKREKAAEKAQKEKDKKLRGIKAGQEAAGQPVDNKDNQEGSAESGDSEGSN